MNLQKRRPRRIHPGAYAVLVVAVFAATVGVGAAAGAWQVSGRTTAGGEAVAPQGVDVAEIKGWMAIGDVAAAWSVPLHELLAAFGLPADTPASTAIKDLETDTFSVTALRDWLEARHGLPTGQPGASASGDAPQSTAVSASPTSGQTRNPDKTPSKSPNADSTKHPSGSGHPKASASPS